MVVQISFEKVLFWADLLSDSSMVVVDIFWSYGLGKIKYSDVHLTAGWGSSQKHEKPNHLLHFIVCLVKDARRGGLGESAGFHRKRSYDHLY